MSFHEGSNWQAKKEDEGKPLYDNKSPQKPIPTEQQDGEMNFDPHQAQELISRLYKQIGGLWKESDDFSKRIAQLKSENESLRKQNMLGQIGDRAKETEIARLQSLLNNQQWTDELISDYMDYCDDNKVYENGDLRQLENKSPSEWLIERTQSKD